MSAPTHVLLGERVDELGQDLVAHHGLGQVVRVVGQAAQRQRRRLLDRRNLMGRSEQDAEGEKGLIMDGRGRRGPMGACGQAGRNTMALGCAKPSSHTWLMRESYA